MPKGTETRAPQGRLRHIEGRHNPLLKELRWAFAHSEPTADGFCAIEGLRIIEEAIRSGLKFRAVFFSESGEARAPKLLPQLGAHVETILLPDKLFAGAVPSETPQGAAALVRCPEFSLKALLDRASNGPLLVIAGLQDPGNLGTILRSAEAFGAAGVILGEGTVNAFNSKVVRASAGSVFRLPITKSPLKEAIRALRERGVRLVGTSSHKGTPVSDAQLTGPVAIFVGSEGAGMPREVLAEIDEMVVIPHSASVESLNAGVAASIILYEASRPKKILSS